jgi:hypothetical protein
MGLVKKSSIKEYWNKKDVSQSTPWFSKMFSRNRFQLILRFFHLVDNTKTPQRNTQHYNPAAWFKPLIDHANMRFKQFYVPQQELSIDESLVGTKARSVMTQYIPTKSHKFGIKLWLLVEASTGYILHILPYRGRRYDPVSVGETQGSQVIITLMESANLLNKWHHIFCDNFFTSITLANRLYTLKTYITGTLRANRIMPRLMHNVTLGENESVFLRQGPLLGCAYKERRNRRTVRFISTAMPAIHIPHDKPIVATTYNKYMGGVDLNDMMTSTYDDGRKSTCMWKRVAYNILHRMMLNAYILYQQNTDGDRILSRIKFIQVIVEELSGDRVRRRDQQVNRNRNRLVHLERGKQRNCIVCTRPNIRSRASTICNRCNKGVHVMCMYRHNCDIEL